MSHDVKRERVLTAPNDAAQKGKIGELAQQVGVNPKTIRYYEDIGLLPEPERTESGYRMYSEDDVERLSFIRAAKDFGFTLGEIREILAARDRDEVPCPYVLSLVHDKLGDLHDRIRRLEALSADLEEILREVEAIPPEVRARKGVYCHVIQNRRLREQGEGLPS